MFSNDCGLRYFFQKGGKLIWSKIFLEYCLCVFWRTWNSETMLTIEAESPKILYSCCSIPPHHTFLSLTLEILIQPSEHCPCFTQVFCSYFFSNMLTILLSFYFWAGFQTVPNFWGVNIITPKFGCFLPDSTFHLLSSQYFTFVFCAYQEKLDFTLLRSAFGWFIYVHCMQNSGVL